MWGALQLVVLYCVVVVTRIRNRPSRLLRMSKTPTLYFLLALTLGLEIVSRLKKIVILISCEKCENFCLANRLPNLISYVHAIRRHHCDTISNNTN